MKIRQLLTSPVLHFVVLGVLAFIGYTLLIPADRETIVITRQTLEALILQEQNISPGPVSEERKQELIENYIDEEILIREAYNRGLDKNDYRVRQRILYIMRNTLSEVIPEPSIAQLRAWFEENTDRYLTDTSRSVEHVFFFPNSELPANPGAFIEQIRGSPNFEQLGDFFQMGNRIVKSNYRQMAMRFGKPFTEQVFSLPVDEWTGPVESNVGFHYLRVTEVHDPAVPRFEDLESYLRTDYLLFKTRELQQDKIDQIRKNYDVVVAEELGSGT